MSALYSVWDIVRDRLAPIFFYQLLTTTSVMISSCVLFLALTQVSSQRDMVALLSAGVSFGRS